MYISVCFYTKRAKRKQRMFIELACTATYTVFACGEQAGFVFMPSRLSCRVRCSTQTQNLLFFFLFIPLSSACRPEVFAFSLSKCAVCKFVLLFCSFCSAEKVSNESQRSKQRQGGEGKDARGRGETCCSCNQ